MGRDRSVGIATRYGLYGPGIEARWGGGRFSAPVQTGPGVHPAFCTMGTASFPGVKRPGRGVDHSPPSSAEVKEIVELYLYSLAWAFVAEAWFDSQPGQETQISWRPTHCPIQWVREIQLAGHEAHRACIHSRDEECVEFYLLSPYVLMTSNSGNKQHLPRSGTSL